MIIVLTHLKMMCYNLLNGRIWLIKGLVSPDLWTINLQLCAYTLSFSKTALPNSFITIQFDIFPAFPAKAVES
jgi:hypothetical protein